MFCKKCGKEIPDDTKICPACQANLVDLQNENLSVKDKNKKTLVIVLISISSIAVLLLIVLSIIFIGSNREKKIGAEQTTSNLSASTKASTNSDISTTSNSNNLTRKDVDKDDAIGLSGIKIYNEGSKLTNTEKLIIQYFDEDYFFILNNNYNSLQRYPNAYKNAQIKINASIKNVISSTDTEYVFFADSGDGEMDSGNYIAIKGSYSDTRPIINDNLFVYGKYTGIDTYSVDGKSYTIPTIQVIRYLYVYSFSDFSHYFSQSDIKLIAQAIFGPNIKITVGAPEESETNGYFVELDNQSNANFTKYWFDPSMGGYIYDMKNEENTERTITFLADFKHFLVSIYDYSMSTYTLECYDKSLKKLWSKEFTETTSADMDYTADHIYVVENGSLHILNVLNGKDAIKPKYVGAKIDIRKLSDGLLLISASQSDSVMKTDLTGNILWSINTAGVIGNSSYDPPVVQLINGRYVINYSEFTDISSADYIAVITPDGIKEMDEVSSEW